MPGGLGQLVRGNSSPESCEGGPVACTLVSSTMLMPGHRGRQYIVWGTKGQ